MSPGKEYIDTSAAAARVLRMNSSLSIDASGPELPQSPPTTSTAIDAVFQRYLFYCALGLTAFVIYGSLVPFERRDYNLAQAVDLFVGIQYLQLGTASRADWIANALIYLPVAYCWHGYLQGRGGGLAMRLWVLPLLLVLAVTIEFVQIFIAPRTVSLNDLLAEGIGILLGFWLWSSTGTRLKKLCWPLLGQGRIDCGQLLSVYLLLYCAWGLFPFDFYVSVDELLTGVEQKNIGLMGDPRQWLSASFILAKVLDLLIAIPVGLLACQLGQLQNRRHFLSYLVPALLLIEGLQLLLASGTVLLLPVLFKIAGGLLGWQLAVRWPDNQWLTNSKGLLKLFKWLALPYLLLLCLVKGWGIPETSSLSDISQRLSEVSFLPFYYHYFATEVRAMLSLMGQSLMLAPLGLYLAVRDQCRHSTSSVSRILTHGLLLSLILEIGTFIGGEKHPDPTNVLIGAIAVWAAYALSGLVYRSLTTSAGERPSPTASVEQASLEETTPPPFTFVDTTAPTQQSALEPVLPHASWPARCLGLLAAIALCSYLLDHPLWGVPLLGGALFATLVIIRWPASWLGLLAAAIPLMDLYVISGRFLLTELDGLVLLICALGYVRGHYLFPLWRQDPWLYGLLLALAGCYLMSLAQSLVPWPAQTTDSLTSFYSPLNSLRISKSLGWALLLLPLLNFQYRNDPASPRRFGHGMLLGLVLLSLLVLIERLLFTGLDNFLSSHYRIKGSFATMHTGGSHIDAYLMMALPFIALLLSRSNSKRTSAFIRLCGALILLAVTLYVVFVTYSRAPYAVTVVLGLLMLGGYLFGRGKKQHKGVLTGLLLMGGSLGLLWLSVPFLYDTVLSERIEQSARDKGTRLDHWRTAIDLVDSQGGSRLWGNGPGTFPYQLLLDQTVKGAKHAVHHLEKEQNNHFLRISSGENIYTSQYVSIDPWQTYRLTFNARNTGKTGQLTLPLCETWIMDSSRCAWHSLTIPAAGHWQSFEQQIKMTSFQPSLGASDKILRRPIALSLFSAISQPYIDIDNIRLEDEQGNNILNNGDFEQNKDHWYFTADNHLLWHSKNLLVNVYHDFGLAGLTLLLALTGLTLTRLMQMVAKGNHHANALLCSLCGFLGIGLVGSLFDVPQLSLLFYLLVLNGGMLWQYQRQPASVEESLARQLINKRKKLINKRKAGLPENSPGQEVASENDAESYQ